MELLLGVRLSPTEKMSVIKLNDVNVKENIANLRNKASGQINLPIDSFDMIYCGCLLENESSLESYGLKSGSMIHILKKNETVDAANNSTTTASDVNPETLASIYKSFTRNPMLELALKRLARKPGMIDNIISATPGLSEDAVAIAILQDPDLLLHFRNAETIQKITKLHPALLEGAQQIASAVHEEAHIFAASSATASTSTMSNNQAASSSYSLENMSDDEMAGDSSQSSDSTQPSSSTNQSRNNAYAAYNNLLAAMTRAERDRSNDANNMNNTSTPISTHSRSNSNSGGVITFEMFHQAMQQAFASSPATSNPSSTPQPSPSPAFANNTVQNPSNNDNMQGQISIMHEMGLQNDAINLQALQVTNGDVQAAIELVLNGFGDN